MTKRKNAAEPKPPAADKVDGSGRPGGDAGGPPLSTYRGEESCRIANALARLGAADGAIAEALGITKSTLNIWRQTHEEFSEALRTPPDLNDAAVERAVLQMALGYNYEVDKLINTPAGPVVRKKTVHNPPSGKTALFLLQARMPGRWGNKKTPTKTQTNDADFSLRRCLEELDAKERENTLPIYPPKDDSCRVAQTMTRLGATNDEIAAALGMSLTMFEEVCDTREEFSVALRAGKQALDEALERAFMQCAIGYSHSEDEVFCTRAGDIVRTHGSKSDDEEMWWRPTRPEDQKRDFGSP